MMTVVSQTAILTTNRLILRSWRRSDREPFARMNADPRVMEFFAMRLSPEESDSMLERIETHFRQNGFGLWAAELRRDGAFVGFVGFDIPSYEAPYSVELGWRLAREHWGQGLATEGAQAVVGYGFRTLAFREIVATTVPANTRSRRVMEKLGMTHDSADDFEHPLLPEGHALRRHVLYRLRRLDWQLQPGRKISATERGL
jgi:RimJ/RimL family protein N-acetyltransferase